MKKQTLSKSQEFANQFVRIRKSKHLSRDRLSAISGLSHSAIARFELGTADPRLSTVMTLLGSMDLTLDIVDNKEEDEKK